jgi:hypothetical protein
MKLDSGTLVLDPDQLATLCMFLIEVARLRLANAVLPGFQSGVREAPMIRAALRRMGRWHNASRGSSSSHHVLG